MKFELKDMPTLQLKVERIQRGLKYKGIIIADLKIGEAYINLNESTVTIIDKDVFKIIETGLVTLIDENAKEPKIPEKPCELCGQVFQPKHRQSAAKYCSQYCSIKARKIKNNTNQKNHRDSKKEAK